MITRFKFVLLFSLAVAASEVYAQDPTYSQFDANQTYYNPAYTGYKKDFRVRASYRNQWPNVPGKVFPGPLSNYMASADAFFSILNRFNAGGGVYATQSVAGEGLLTTSSFGISYSQHMPGIRSHKDRMERFSIYFGFKVYYNSIHVDWRRLVFSDQLNATYGITNATTFDQMQNSKRNYIDFDYGILIRNNFRAKGKWYNEIGFAMAHVLKPTISITGSTADGTRLPRKYTFTYRSTIDLQDGNFYISPAVMLENQTKFYEVNGGVDFYMKFKTKRETIPLSIGLYNRFSFILKNSETRQYKINTSAVILSVTHRGNFMNGKYAMGYSIGASVDFPYMGLGMQTAGAYEMTMGVSIPYRKSNKMKCPFEAF